MSESDAEPCDAERRLRQPDFVPRCGADETGIHAVGDGVEDGMASAIGIKSEVCGWQLGIGRLDSKGDGMRSDWVLSHSRVSAARITTSCCMKRMTDTLSAPPGVAVALPIPVTISWLPEAPDSRVPAPGRVMPTKPAPDPGL